MSGDYQKLSTPVNGAVVWLRRTGGQTLLVAHNVTDRPLRIPISADAGIPSGQAQVRFGLPLSTDVVAPQPTAGAVVAWIPFAELPPRTSVVVELGL